MNPNNKKYEITDIAHEKYPFLHRIRALRDVGSDVKAGDLGGFVEGEHNLSHENDAWIYDDAIAANAAFVEGGASLRDEAVVCGEARVRGRAVISGHARVEDHAVIDGAWVKGFSKVSAHGIVSARSGGWSPTIAGGSVVHGIVTGNVLINGEAVVLGDEKIVNEVTDRLILTDEGRRVERSPGRDRLVPSAEYFGQDQPKRKQGHKRKEAQR